ncbi:MAG: formate dehydrogenase subunit alpha [Gemmatimonadetes bacterium]|nr:formate dehydrogenase subunit alpha [Gemmatimonadota bacterium]
MSTNGQIPFVLDGREVLARPGETILQSARRHGVAIPYLCYQDGMRADGNCRACVVEIQGERVLAPSCCRQPAAGMVVCAANGRARKAQRMVLELLLADMPPQPYREDSELHYWVRTLEMGTPRFAPARTEIGPNAAPDLSHPAMAVRLDACIQCTRCVRACREVQVNDVIGFAGRGAHSRVVFDLEDPMGESSCVGCGECVQSCPTGALLAASPGRRLAVSGAEAGARVVPTLCPYCGVGCQLSYHVRDNRIIEATGRWGPSNHGRLCVKGRYGSDYVHHPHRLLTPLVRHEGAAKDARALVDPAHPEQAFREATWEEALELAAAGLRRILERDGGQALAGFGSAKGSNEEAYLFQKLVRAGFGSNNVDHCTRLCHASSVAALLEGIGSGAVSNPVADVAYADVMMVVGSNTTENHPVAATFMKNAVERGARLILLDPRRHEMARFATHFLQFRPATDVAVLNAMLHTIIAEGLVNERFVAERTEGFEELRRRVVAYSPEAMEPVCGIPAATLREVARLYATSPASMIFWGMGISQHVHGTDNARCLIALALVTGQIGRRGTGLHPLRGQNNVQGASDVGLIPMVYPDYQPVSRPEVREFFETLWGRPLDPNPGLTVVEIMNAARAGRIRGMYIMGENPAMSDPDVDHAREALAALEWLVVQDIFLTETASFADVVLPASAFPEKTGTFTNTDRRVQLGRQALEPPGQARHDLWIIQEMARCLGLDWRYDGPADVWNEIRRAAPSLAGITWQRLEREHGVTYPCRAEGDPGDEVIFTERFPTPSGRGKLVPVDLTPGAEPPDEEYPYVLITGRLLEHWHTGAITRRAAVLDAIEPAAMASLHGQELARLGVEAGGALRLETRRGRITAIARRDDGIPRGAVFIPFCYVEAAANLLTNPALDPMGKIPEFKYCGVRIDAVRRARHSLARRQIGSRGAAP